MSAAEGSDSDRAAALIMASFADVAMNGLIAYAIRVPDLTALKALFIAERGPLYEFASKIYFAKAIHIIGKDTTNNLEVIRNVRNTFAHAIADIDFDTSEISRACNRLILYNEHVSLSNRLKFGLACDIIYQRALHLLFTRQLSGSLSEKLFDSPLLP